MAYAFITNAPFNAFFLIYLLISCNFLAELFGLRLQELLRENIIFKHIVGFLTLTFLIVFAQPYYQRSGRYLEAFIYSIVLYTWFILTTKTHIYVTLLIIFLFMLLYILQLWKDSLNITQQKEKIKEIESSQIVITIIAFVVTVFGVIQYYYTG